MAIITISRQFASLGDEIAFAAAEKLGYKCITREAIEKKILQSGFDPEELKKFDEKKPGFFASLTRNRDHYLDTLKTIIYETALEGNCVIIGRGSNFLLEGVSNHLAVRVMCDSENRIKRLCNEQNVSEREAKKILKERDKVQKGYYKSFFETDIKKSAPFHLVLNTGLLDVDTASTILAASIKGFNSKEQEKSGNCRIEEVLIAQRLVNMLLIDYDIAVHFLRAEINGKQITLHGLADSSATVERALTICRLETPDYEVKSFIKVVQDTKR